MRESDKADLTELIKEAGGLRKQASDSMVWSEGLKKRIEVLNRDKARELDRPRRGPLSRPPNLSWAWITSSR
jgi:hypothetical protein